MMQEVPMFPALLQFAAMPAAHDASDVLSRVKSIRTSQNFAREARRKSALNQSLCKRLPPFFSHATEEPRLALLSASLISSIHE
jgi:hypothetical protein